MTDCIGMGVYLWREIFGQCLLVSNSIFLEYKEFTTIVHYSGFLDVQQMACNMSPVLIIYLAECNLPSHSDTAYCEMKKIDAIWPCHSAFPDPGVID